MSALPSYRSRALVAVGLMLLFLGAAVFRAETARATGEEIVLETQPIDPRDIFFGHYATLSYAASRVELPPLADAALAAASSEGRLAPAARPRIAFREFSRARLAGDFWVAFRKTGDFHEPALLTQDRKAAAAIGVPARVQAFGEPSNRCGKESGPACYKLTDVRLLLPNRYYADPETALAVEESARAAQSFERDRRRFEDCEASRRAAVENPESTVPDNCADVVAAPESDAVDFAVILAAPKGREPVIKGLIIDGERIIDTLAGPRRTIKREKPEA